MNGLVLIRCSDGVRAMRIRIQIGAVLLATSFVATFLANLLGCYPIEKHWQINPDPGSMYPLEHEHITD